MYSYEQLMLVGSNAVVTDSDSLNDGIGRGQAVTDTNNAVVLYSPDAVYSVAQDITIPAGTVWTLPAGFTGSFVAAGAEESPLYDAETDTIYVYHPYQLATMAMEDAAEQPVLSQDADAATFGMGQLIFSDDEAVDYLTYAPSHNYVITKSFSYAAAPSAAAAPQRSPSLRGANDPTEGRDYKGQVSKEINGTTYILIGDRQQLDAITANGTTRTKVCKPVYKATEGSVEVYRSGSSGVGDWIWLSEFDGSKVLKDGNGYGNTAAEVIASYNALASGAEVIYPGDADLVGDFAQSPLYDVSSGSYHKLDRPAGTATSKRSSRVVYFTTNETTGQPDITTAPLTAADPTEGSLKYEKDGNYIVFRDIDMSVGYNVTVTGGKGLWTPLMFTGTMYGAKSANGEKLWDGSAIGDATEITATTEENRPVISNVAVNKTDTMMVNEYIGVGFFATITNRTEAANIGVSGGTAIVKNLELQNINVANNTNTAGVNQTLLNAVTSTLGTVLGGLLDGLLWVLSFGSTNTDLNTTLSNLLNARANDPTIYATGTFAGRIVGDVLIEDCLVSKGENGSLTVSNINNYTGGFVGYMEGMTEYDGLSQVLGGLTDLLAGILNLIPGVGLGDLIDILLGNALPLNQLIPTGYESPLVKDCGVNGLYGDVGRTDRSFAGGFVGQQIGAHVDGSYIENSNYWVKALRFGGGFSGIGRDAVIEGLLDGVGVDLSTLIKNIQNIHPQTILTDDEIRDCVVTVAGADYLGGFVGDLNNSYSVDCFIRKTEIAGSAVTVTVNGTGNYIGGYSGCATVGWGASLGKDENTTNSLLGTVGQLLTGLLSSDPAAQKMLLTIAGVGPSAILGSQITVDTVTVTAGESFAGGILGKGDAVLIKISDQLAFDELDDLNAGEILAQPTDTPVLLSNLVSVTAGGDYVGGIAGHVGSASVDGLLNNTVSLGEFIGFSVRSVTVVGVSAGYTVQTTGTAQDLLGNNAGGGFGITIGGTVQHAHLYNLASVTANNRAGGFVGVSGPGELAGSNGLTVNLLGLNHLINLSNLLSIGKGVEVHIYDSTVTGIPTGFTATAVGVNTNNDVIEYTAAGFVAKSNSTKISNCHAYNILSVTATDDNGFAGGFVGTSETGGLADVADENTVNGLITKENGAVVSIDGLVNAIGYLLPKYTDCTANYVDGGFVDADIAGGFVADLRSGTVDNSLYKRQNGEGQNVSSPYAVYNIDRVYGRTFGGGFGGKLVSGALANAGKGVSILGGLDLSLNISDLLSVVNAYVPYIKYAGVYSENGFTVEANTYREGELLSGSAGGFAGYTSGAQISYSDVMKLKKTTVTPPSDLECAPEDAQCYYDDSSYSVSGAQYAGGYAGNIDIGSAASLGNGLTVLNLINVSNLLSALSVVVTTVEHSSVYGRPGGFSVLATGMKDGVEVNNSTLKPIGMSGGFVGKLSGGHIQNSHSKNFSYIIGEEAAGGYLGKMEPGDIASVLGEAGILSQVFSGLVGIEAEKALASVGQDFVPTIRNSTTTCIPCGGAVRANSPADEVTQRGMAGGFAGYNHGGNIWGMNDNTWKDQNDGVIFEDTGLENHTGNNKLGSYTGEKHTCAAYRIYSVYGCEYAGGFTGLMDCGDTASTGSMHLLFNLVNLDSLLGALSIVYPTEENTAVYGPLSHLDYQTFKTWVEYIGKRGAYGEKLSEIAARLAAKESDPTADLQAELDEALAEFVYGFNVVAGRESYEQGANISTGGNAGGYVGAMRSGTVTNGQSYDVRMVKAMANAGGFAGEMSTGGAANLGSTNILGLPNIDLGKLVSAVQVFLPVVKTSSVHGYNSGVTVICTGSGNSSNNINHSLGNAGGFVGASRGGQIWGDSDKSDNPGGRCDVENLKKVQSVLNAGGYAGLITAASVADVNTNASSGLLQRLLDTIISKPGDLLTVLQATIPTVRKAKVSPADEEWGFTVEGVNNDIPHTAGGFVGSSEAGVLGSRKGESDLTVTGLRGVLGGEYAGGFFGLGDVGSVASVSGNNETGGQTSILHLIKAGEVSVLDAFRTYIYYASVKGVPDGYSVKATSASKEGILESTRFTGCAGGFGGGLLNGSVKYSSASKLNSVDGLNYVGGFIGHFGKNGTADVDNANILDKLNLVGATAGVLDVFGSHADDCSVTGRDRGFTVTAHGDGTENDQPIAGGFTGYGDLSKIDGCTVDKLKKVESAGSAGGFIGRTDMNYLVNAEVSSVLVNAVLKIVNFLVKALYLDNLENLGLINVGLGDALGLKVLSDGDLLYVNLLGLKISAALSKANPDDPDATDVAIVTIGNSTVRLPCTNEGLINNEQENVEIHLIKGNPSNTENSTVTGISIGYDVFAGTKNEGCAGGFVGYNKESYFVNDTMVLCDEIRGMPGKVGPFSGNTSLKTVYHDTVRTYEGDNNTYSIYRLASDGLTAAYHKNGTAIDFSGENEIVKGKAYTRFDVTHLGVIVSADSLKEAYATDADNGKHMLDLYHAANQYAKVVLMLGQSAPDNEESLVPETSEMQYPCENSVDLTINKIWDRQGDRSVEAFPASVEVKLYRTSSADNHQAKTLVGTYTLSAEANQNNAFTANVWSLKIEDLPATYEENGEVYFYRYTAEEPAVSGYYSAIVPSDYGYTWNVFNTHCGDQCIVVDYGIPVNVSVLDYLRIKFGLSECDLTLLGLSDKSDFSGIYYKEDKNANGANVFKATFEGDYGTNTLSGEKLTYQLNAMNMQLTDVTALEVRCVEDRVEEKNELGQTEVVDPGRTSYVYTTVTFVPASMIYYEDTDRFITFSSTGWQELTAAGAASAQDEDRPDVDEILKAYEIDKDNVYGYDSAYENSVTYSLGSTHKATVSDANNPLKGGSGWPYAEFTFTGVGFDVIGLSSSATGTVRVQVFKPDATATGGWKQIKNWMVDTYYGYERTQDGYSRIQFRLVNGKWHTHKDIVTEKGSDETGLPSIEQAQENTTYVIYEKHYVWTPITGGSDTTLYQVPIISSEERLTGYGTYKVRVTPMYASNFDPLGNGSYDLYLDGVRIYTPVETDSQDEIYETYYTQDREGWPEFFELRDFLIDEAGRDMYSINDQTVNLVDLVDREALSDQIGENDEIILDPGQSITFSVDTSAAPVVNLEISAWKLQELYATLGIEIDGETYPEVTVDAAEETYSYIIPSGHQFSGGTMTVKITNTDIDGERVALSKLRIHSFVENVGEYNKINGVVFIDGVNPEDGAREYEMYGPNNEIYLAPGQSIVFGVETTATVADMQISAKKLQEDDAKLGISIGSYMLPDDVKIVSASEMYYSIFPSGMAFLDGTVPVTITNKSNNGESVSIIKLKVTYSESPTAPAALVIDAPMLQLARKAAFVQYMDGITTCFHTYVFTVTEMPTAASEGKAMGVCKDCGETVTVELPALSEDLYECSEITAATCTGTGELEYLLTETEYGDIPVIVEIEALGHKFERVSTDAGEVLQCSRCGLITDAEDSGNTEGIEEWSIFRFLKWLVSVLKRILDLLKSLVAA
ncbi:MAG: peptidase M26 [Clostridia bacterium]|nr:peptidase M26 [Clostridia bacterium]